MPHNLYREIHQHFQDSRFTHGTAHLHETRLAKRYERMELVPMDHLSDPEVSLFRALELRNSDMPSACAPLSFSDISHLLGGAMKLTERKRRPYPSGGGYYPIEAYLLAFSVETLQRAVFHYRPDVHALEHLWALSTQEKVETYVSRTESLQGANVLLLTASLEKSSRKYHDFAYPLALLEAGHIMQNMALVATALGVRLRPFGGLDHQAIEKVLDIDPQEELVVYGALAARQKEITQL
ncbi:MAG: SagB/ThcOx family dehydrogenase [Patescibacteria group bacterium]